MFIDFGNGKCPMCGDFGREVEQVIHCIKCQASYDGFWLLSDGEDREKDWN